MGIDTPLSVAEVTDGFVEILLEHGPEKVPPAYRRATIAACMARLSDFDLGFLFFWLHFATLQIKGKGEGTGWQRACPNGKPGVQESTGRDWAWQVEMARVLPQFVQLLILKARQIGFSFLLANFIVWAAIAFPDQIIAVVANKLQSSKRLMRRARSVYNRLPKWLRDEVEMTSPAIMGMEFSNGSRIEPYSGDPDATRSDAADWIIVDEIGEVEHLHEFYAAIESIADDGGRLIMFGTAKDNGLEDFVTPAALDGEEVASCDITLSTGEEMHLPIMLGDDDMHFLFVPDYVHPTRTDEWYDRRRKSYRGNLRDFDKEHPRNWRDAFAASGLGYFDVEPLRVVREETFAYLGERDRRGTLLAAHGDPTDIIFREDPYGFTVIHATEEEFVRLMAKKRPFAIGVDSAGDKIHSGGDAHAATALRVGNAPEPGVETPESFVLERHIQLITIHGRYDSDLYAEQVCRMGYLCGTALVAVETNGVGAAVMKSVRRLRYPALYTRRSRSAQRGAEKLTREYGWYSSNETKNIAYGELERCLRNGYTDVRDYETVLEMGNVLNLGGGKIGAKDPKHDDRPDGLSLAHAIIPHVRAFNGGVVIGAEPEPEWGTLAWLDKMAAAHYAAQNKDATIIGNENHKIMAR